MPRIGGYWVEASPVVAHLEANCVVLLGELEEDGAGSRVFDDVVQGFLGNLEDVEAKETFRQAERLAQREKVARCFVYEPATPEKLAQVWSFVRPRNVILPEALIDHTEGINPDRLRYQLTSNSKVAHLVKHW